MYEKLRGCFCNLDQVPEKYRLKGRLDGTCYLLNGLLKHYSARTVPVHTPLMLEEDRPKIIGEYGRLPAEEALLALEAAERAFDSGMGAWPCMSIKERVECMELFLKRMKNRQDEFTILEMWEIGKKFSECVDEFKRTLTYIEKTIRALENLDKESARIIQINGTLAQIKRNPLGVILCLGPFNYPLNETFALIIPALLMGNTVLLKLPDPGSLCTLPLLDDFAASFPPGVINIINGEGKEIIDPIMKAGTVSVLGFIGSSQVANILISQHPHNNRLRTILGLEAKNAAFVMPDADLELAVAECTTGALEFNGQRCTAIKQIWVHEAIKEQFLARMEDSIIKAGFGMPWDDCMITPLAEPNKAEFLDQLLEDACLQGAQIVNRHGGNSCLTLYYPAVLYPVSQGMKIYSEEQFGPIIPVSSFSSLEELQPYFRSTKYGQQASIFTRSTEHAAPLLDYLVNQVSRVNLNAKCQRGPDELPFTGRKDSAEGTLSVNDALRAFSIRSLAVANNAGRELFFSLIASGRSRFLRI